MVEAEEVAEATEPLPHLLAMEPLKIMPLQVDTVHLRATPPVEDTELPRTTHLAVDMAPKRS